MSNQNSKKTDKIRLAIIGDLLLTTRPGAAEPGRGLEALGADIRDLFRSCDLVLANLECTLPGEEKVATEPRVFTTEAQVRTLRDAGVNAVSLGNNHTFDAFDAGFQRLIDLLAELDIKWCGAGYHRQQACEPLVWESQGVKVAVFGVVDASSGMQRFATETASGVAPLDLASLCRQVSTWRRRVDHVIVSPHWGNERFLFPAPAQIEQARRLVEAGATLVVGHHPHVLQGMERRGDGAIAYSLGNFFANHVYWDNGDYLTWNRFEKTSCILLVELDKTGLRQLRQIPVFDHGATINIEKSGWGDRCLEKVNRLLARGVTPARYRREAFRVRTIKPILAHLRWSKLRRLRPEHFRKAIQLFQQGIK